MDLKYPIYLTRLLSSLFVGLLIIAFIKWEFSLYNALSLEFDFQKNLVAKHLINLLGKIKPTVSILFYLLPISFLIGELFSGVAENFILDPLYSNIRSSKESFNLLEFSDITFYRLYQKWWLILFLCFVPIAFKYIQELLQDNIKLKAPISFKKFNKFIEERERNFSLSEMYFNMHRILGGCALLFWLLFLLWLFSILNAKCGRLYDIGYAFTNLGLMIFCMVHAIKQRKFANKLIYFS